MEGILTNSKHLLSVHSEQYIDSVVTARANQTILNNVVIKVHVWTMQTRGRAGLTILYSGKVWTFLDGTFSTLTFGSSWETTVCIANPRKLQPP